MAPGSVSLRKQRRSAKQESSRARTRDFCKGVDGMMCRFRRDGSGDPAQASVHSEHGQCVFCDRSAMQKVYVTASKSITRALNTFKQKDAELHRAALDRRSRFLADDMTFSRKVASQRRVSQRHVTVDICKGLDGMMCRFRRDGSGDPAQASVHSEHGQCVFCDRSAMQKVYIIAPSSIARALNTFKRKDAELHRAALDRRSRFLIDDMTFSWKAALERRVSQQHVTAEDARRGDRARSQDKERAARKLPEIFGPDAAGTAWQTPIARAFEKWAEEESWLMCPKCERLLQQRFLPGTSGTDATTKTRQAQACLHCGSGEKAGYPAPTPEDVPEALRCLPANVVEALRPFRISCGLGLKAPNGYWVHTAPIRFSWKDRTLEDRIGDIEDDEARQQTERAAEWLLDKEDCAYKKFDELQRMFVTATNRDEDVSPRMPLQFMETIGIECAAWPHLYWETRMCETYVRSRDKRRLDRAQEDDNDNDAEDMDDTPGLTTERRQSSKASYFAKLLSRIIGYGTEFELVQFIYDLWLHTGIGGAGNTVKTELRSALAGKSFSPEFWRTKHLALQDLQSQIGTPTLFVTLAPYEWTAPYHRWVSDEMYKTARSRTNLPAAESLHLAHILTEAVRGLLTGSYSESCRQHCLLAAKTKVTFFARLEFQDGKRQTPEQQLRMQWYYGRGTVHVSRASMVAGHRRPKTLAEHHRSAPPGSWNAIGISCSRLSAGSKEQLVAPSRGGVHLG